MADTLRSARILARPVTEADTDAILGIYEANRDLLVLLDRENDPGALTTRFTRSRNLPPGGTAQGLRNLVLCEIHNGAPMGLLSLYMGYPEKDVAYIGELFLHPDFQGAGIGREICLRLEAVLRNGPARRVRVGVGLRNWNALRFWVRQGYVHVTGMSGDRCFTPEGHAFLELEKNL
jgi:ribosomal protein S18 acetylase RimI-like enzyme